jgi:hypothetical protein
MNPEPEAEALAYSLAGARVSNKGRGRVFLGAKMRVHKKTSLSLTIFSADVA